MLTLNLLGPVTTALDGTPFDRFGTKRGQALLIYLALENDHAQGLGRVHGREALMHLLWPDMPLKYAQGNLRQVIYRLRKGFQDAGLTELPYLANRQTVQINPGFPLAVDVHQFEAAIKTGTLQSRRQAVDLYRGPFLADFFLPDSEPFEEWVTARRALFGRLALDNLDLLATYYLSEENYAAAEEAARRAISFDDLHEPAHRSLLQALAGDGNRGDALAHYESFARRLAKELDIEPDDATQQLLHSIRTGEWVFPTSGILPSLPQNLPAQTKPFIGREDELQQLDHFFADSTTRLVTILGPGGMGKTHLAIEWARGQTGPKANGQTFPDGTYFVDLASLESPDQVAPAMADVFAFPLQDKRRSPEQQIVDYLRHKNLLLILDNFEHIADAATFVNDILRVAPGVNMLVTSRERLHLSSEQVFAIEGLAYPTAPGLGVQDSVKDFGSYPAVQLLLRSAQRIHSGYHLRAEDREAAARICRYTGGMPLAIELAASWVDMLPLSRIAGEIEKCLDVLETDMRDLPPRHRSIRAAINATWNHLLPEEHQTFAILSIFRGGFTWEAATAVLGYEGHEGALRRVLSKLQDKSLLMYEARAERFTIHELLRQYGAEKLVGADYVQERSGAQERHALYYAHLLHDHESHLKGARYAEALSLIEIDLDNVLLSWKWLIEHERRLELAAAMDTLGMFHEVRGYYSVGRRNFRSLAARWRERLANQAPGSEEFVCDVLFLSKSLAWQSVFEFAQEEAEALLQESLTLLNDPRLKEGMGSTEKAFVFYRLGMALQNSQLGRAIEYFNQGLALYEDLDDPWGIGLCLFGLGKIDILLNLVTGLRYLLQASEVFEKSGNVRGLGQALSRLAMTAMLQGDDAILEQAFRRYMALVLSLEKPQLYTETMMVKAIYHFARGDYAQAVVYEEKLIGNLEELGRDNSLSKVFLANYCQHAGQFDQARALLCQTQRELEQAVVENDFRLAFTHHLQAMLDLIEEKFQRAVDLLGEAITIYGNMDDLVNVAGAQALTAIALVGMGELETARPGLITGLKVALDQRAIIPLAEAILGISLLLAQGGQLVRARELYELVYRYPRFQKSALYEAMVGRKIRQLTAALPASDLQAIKERAADLDIWQKSTVLLEELTAAGWEFNNQQ